ncbi:unnamed protein product, partial [Ectocarpus fasciculatus]
ASGKDVYVVDIFSANGTAVNGKKIQPGVLHPLSAGGVLTLGTRNQSFRVIVRSTPPPRRQDPRSPIVSANVASPLLASGSAQPPKVSDTPPKFKQDLVALAATIAARINTKSTAAAATVSPEAGKAVEKGKKLADEEEKKEKVTEATKRARRNRRSRSRSRGRTAAAAVAAAAEAEAGASLVSATDSAEATTRAKTVVVPARRGTRGEGEWGEGTVRADLVPARALRHRQSDTRRTAGIAAVVVRGEGKGTGARRVSQAEAAAARAAVGVRRAEETKSGRAAKSGEAGEAQASVGAASARTRRPQRIAPGVGTVGRGPGGKRRTAATRAAQATAVEGLVERQERSLTAGGGTQRWWQAGAGAGVEAALAEILPKNVLRGARSRARAAAGPRIRQTEKKELLSRRREQRGVAAEAVPARRRARQPLLRAVTKRQAKAPRVRPPSERRAPTVTVLKTAQRSPGVAKTAPPKATSLQR